MENKETVRYAEIKGKGIKKGCRKEDWLFVSAWGRTEEELYEKLNEAVKKEVSKYKSYTFREKFLVMNAELNHGIFGESLCHLVYVGQNLGEEYNAVWHNFSDYFHKKEQVV